MAGKRLLVLAPGELTRDPRARRAALVARKHGLDVVGLCGGGSDTPIPLAEIDVRRIRPPAVTAALRRLGLGGMKRERPIVRELRGIFRLARLGLTTARLVHAARALGPVDVVHANDLDTLPSGWLIARRHRARLVYDAHELYTLQEPDPPRIHRAATRAFERLLAARADAVVTVADAIADELVRLLRLRDRPIVVLNCPAAVDVPPPTARDRGRLEAVYQGAMGPGRPLGDLLAVAAEAQDVHLTLRIAGADRSALERDIRERGLADRIDVVEPVPPDRLVEALVDYDIGLIINRPITRNDEFVLPNKLFEYFMAGLAVAAPRLPALTPIAGEAGVLFEPGRPDILASELQALAGDRRRLDDLRRRAYAVARERYNAEAQSVGYVTAWGTAELDTAR